MHACTCVRLILVLVCGIMYHIRTYLVSARLPSKIRICRYVCTRATSPPQKKEQKAQHRLRERHTHSATVIAQQGACNNDGQRYRGCTCCLMDTESLMIRRPFGSIDPNSVRETELHTECRRRRERESLNSPRCRVVVQASCGEKHSTEWRLPTWCSKRRSPLVPSRTDSSNLHVI